MTRVVSAPGTIEASASMVRIALLSPALVHRFLFFLQILFSLYSSFSSYCISSHSGERCRFRHVQKVMCENYYLGFCPDGPSCKFGHPQWDATLPQSDDSGPPGVVRMNANLICHTCGQPGHKAQFCPSAPKTNERKPIEEVRPFHYISFSFLNPI